MDAHTAAVRDEALRNSRKYFTENFKYTARPAAIVYFGESVYGALSNRFSVNAIETLRPEEVIII